MGSDEIDLKNIILLLFSKIKIIFIINIICISIIFLYLKQIPHIYNTTSAFSLPSKEIINKLNEIYSISSLSEEIISRIDEIVDASKLIDEVYPNPESRKGVFQSFTNNLSSSAFQREIFDNGGYLNKLALDDKLSKNELKNQINNFLNSVKVLPPELGADDRNSLLEYSYTIEMEGGNSSIQNAFLDELIINSNQSAINNIILSKKFYLNYQIESLKNARQHVFDSLNNMRNLKISELELELQNVIDLLNYMRKLKISELELELQGEILANKMRDTNNINLLTRSRNIAIEQGVITNNFLTVNNVLNGDDSNQVLGGGTFPQWFLYGESALNSEIKYLKNREVITNALINLKSQISTLKNNNLENESIITLKSQISTLKNNNLENEELIALDFTIQSLENRIADFENMEYRNGLSAMSITKYVSSITIDQNKLLLLIVGAFFSLIFSIFIILLINLFSSNSLRH